MLLIALVVDDNGIDGFGEDLFYTGHLFTTALHVTRAHLSRYRHALFLGDGGEALGFKEVDAGSFRAEVGFQPDEDEWCVGAEMENFGIPFIHYVLEGIGTVDRETNE